jgi:polysaccharide pyruvyl transferase WcaK-like protein
MSKPRRVILVWPSSPHLLNSGDIAMLQVTVRRFRKLCPQHRIIVFVQRPDLLKKYCPEAEPLDPGSTRIDGSLIPMTFFHLIPRNIGRWLSTAQRRLLAQWPGSYGALATAKNRVGSRPSVRLDSMIKLLALTDALVSTGGGFINDSFPSVAERILGDLIAGTSLAIPVAMFGQGLGPVTNQEVLRMCRELFPCLSLIGLRDGQNGFRLAAEWMGEPSSRIRITGDDAIEPIYNKRSPNIGNNIGINIRVSNYSGVALPDAVRIADLLRAVASEMSVSLIPIVVSRHPKDSDANSLRAILGDEPMLRSDDNYDSPDKVASSVARCRVMVTGSYHAGVFAMAQGIPVIGLSRSSYYDVKFLGLREQFGGGLELLHLDRPDFGPELFRRVRTMWDGAPLWRDNLLAIASKQIELSKSAYRDFVSALRETETTTQPTNTSRAHTLLQ